MIPGMEELPKIISVDDHVVEPAHVWQKWLPEKFRAAGPRITRERFGSFTLQKGSKYKNPLDPNGQWGDAWLYEDRLIYVHKRHVAIPLDATPGGDKEKFDRSKMTMTAMTNLMCRGRKRGLAGIVATQRLAKLAKNVAAEAKEEEVDEATLLKRARRKHARKKAAEQVRKLNEKNDKSAKPKKKAKKRKASSGGYGDDL